MVVCAGAEAFAGRGRGGAGRREGRGHRRVLAPEEDGDDDERPGMEVAHPDDMIEGIQVRPAKEHLLKRRLAAVCLQPWIEGRSRNGTSSRNNSSSRDCLPAVYL